MKQKYFFVATLFLLLAQFSISQNITYQIDDPEDLRNVIYQAGDVIILKNGTYTTDERMIFLGSGTAEKPVTFRAETPGGVIFTGGPRLTIGGESDGTDTATGKYLVVDGFHWKGGYGASNFIEFRNGQDFAHYSTIQNCVIDGLGVEQTELDEDLADEQITKHRWVVLYGTYNNVINCSFMNKVTAGAIVLGEYSYKAPATGTYNIDFQFYFSDLTSYPNGVNDFQILLIKYEPSSSMGFSIVILEEIPVSIEQNIQVNDLIDTNIDIQMNEGEYFWFKMVYSTGSDRGDDGDTFT